MKVTIVWYSWNDTKLGEQDCPDPVTAFLHLRRLDLNAHAYPTGSKSGLYDWRRTQEHSVDAFIAKMEAINQSQ